MADDPFGDVPDFDAPHAAPDAPDKASDPFGFVPDFDAPKTSATGAFVHAAEREAVPAAGGLAAAGLGAAAGTAVAGPIGTLVGGALGFIGGSWGASTAQDYALSKAPDSWVEALGQDDRQRKLEQEQHPYATFIGGMAPYALTMTPFNAALKELPENATTLQRLLADPKTARVFGGAAMGGMELGQEKVYDDNVNWNKVAIATGFGMIFNRPNAVGERISSLGSRLIPGGAEAPLHPDEPTVTEADAANVMGPGVTEPVFHGMEERDPEAAKAALKNEIVENQVLGRSVLTPEEQMENRARQQDPDLFTKYDALNDRMQTLRDTIARFREPQDDIDALTDRLTGLNKDLDIAKGLGMGLRANQLRAEISGLEAQHAELTERQTAFREGRLQDTPEITNVRNALIASDEELRDVSRQVRAARLQASEFVGSDTVAPPELEAAPETPTEPAAAPTDQTPPVAPEEGAAPTLPIEAQKAAIAADVTRQLTAAGRPDDEATAAGKLIAARFETRAARLKGAAGSPLELYQREGADIRAGGNQITAPTEVSPKDVNEINVEGRAFEQAKRGNIEFDADSVRPVMRLLANADGSTFIHESGHQFLEELFRDAEHPAAPDDLKADAKTVRDYLNIKDGEVLKSRDRRHERFAQSFEQYLREGVAPSRELAGVFAKFRDWLTKIYATLRGLGKPINEDIRGVFDRMLAQSPERTVIAPERAAAESLGAGHALDAIHTAPEHAEAKAEKIAADRVRYVDTLPPEVRNELESKVEPVETHVANAPEAEPGGEVARGAGRSDTVANGDEGSNAIAGRAGGGGESGGVGAGGSETASAGAGVPGGVKPDRQPPRPLATLPTEDISGVDQRTVDLAGNIRLDNLVKEGATDLQIRDAIVASAERNADFRDVRGPTTWSQVAAFAQDAGLNPLQVNVANLQRLFDNTQDLAKYIAAGRVTIKQSAAEITQASVRAAEGDVKAVWEYAQKIDLHDRLQRLMSGVTYNMGAGHSLGFRDISGMETAEALKNVLEQQTGRSFDQLVKMAKFTKNLDSTAKVTRFLANSQERTFGRMMLEYYINNLISGPITHATYVIGNELLLLNHIGLETPVAAAIGRAREMMGATGREHVLPGEVGAMAAEHVRSLPKATQAAIDALRTGMTTRLPGETAYPIPVFTGDTPELRFARTLTNDDVSWREARADAFGLIRGMRDGIVANWGVLKAGGVPDAPLVGFNYSHLGQIPDLAVKGVTVLPIGSTLRLPSRGVAAIHSFFRTVNYSVANAGEAYRIAATEEPTGTPRAERLAELRQNPTDQTMERSKAESNALTLMDQGGELVKHLTKLTNWAPKIPGLGETPILKFIDPFIHISGNIIDQAIVKRTPIGLLSESMRDDIMGRNGPIRQDMAQARMLVGTAMAVTFGGMAAEGLINGSGPTEPRRAAVWRQAGNRAYSVRIGDMWYDMHRLGPLGMLLGLSADAYDVSQHFSSEGFQAGAAAVVHAFAQNIVDESFMRGPAELMQAIEQHDRYGQRYIQNFFSSFVPFSVGMAQMTRASDPYSRQARTILDAMRAKMPFDAGFGQASDLLKRRDIWGEPVPNPSALGHATAIWESRVSTDPVNLAMDALNMGVAPPRRLVYNQKLTDQQYDDYQRIAGRISKQRLDVLVNSPDWRAWPPTSQQHVIKLQIAAARETARGRLAQMYPELRAAAYRQSMPRPAAR